MADEKKTSKIAENLASMVTAENIQKYILGTNKSGQPRALYDVVKDFVTGGKKKKKKNKEGKKSKGGNTFDLYVTAKKSKKKKKKNKHWHI